MNSCIATRKPLLSSFSRLRFFLLEPYPHFTGRRFHYDATICPDRGKGIRVAVRTGYDIQDRSREASGSAMSGSVLALILTLLKLSAEQRRFVKKWQKLIIIT